MTAARRWALAACLGLASLGTARADSWLAPCPKAYLAPSGAYRFIVMPRGPLDTLSCTRAADQPEFAGRLTSLHRATGTLERQTGGRWVPVWAHELSNEVSPVQAAVSDTGRVATFDNWHGVGWGDDVVVLFDAQGRLVRQMGLADFLPRTYVHALPQSVSSILWGGEHAFTADGQSLQLQVVVPDADPSRPRPGDERPPLVTLLVEADTGRVAPQAPVAWAQALAQARQADVVLCAEEVAWFQRELAPRLPPSPRASQADWTQYGYDVIKRLRPGSELPLETCVFNAQTLADRHQVEACLRAAFKAARETPSEVLLIAPDPAVLWPAAQRVLATLPAAALQGSRLYVAASSAQQASVTRALSARGAEVVVFDPGQAVLPTASAQDALRARFDAGEGRDAMGNCGPDARVEPVQ
ncbi:hypothetical protein [Roseateles puraquae]|uniref:hypothetical protein n=1 Tax=Roseateles puraquae TaxID=431059 RepID=UPI0031E19036